MAKPTFEYRGRQRKVEDVHRRATQAGGLYDSFLIPEARTLKIKEGEACIRILPPAPSTDMDKWGDGWEIQVYLHYGVGPDKAAYLCLDKMKGEPCPVCEARRETSDPDEADELKPAWRALCWAIDRDNEKAGPQIWSMPVTLFREINARSVPKGGGGVILVDDPEDGFDIELTRTGTDIKTKYSAVEISRSASYLHDDQDTQDRWLKFVADNPLPDMLNYYDYDYIDKVLSGQSTSRRRAEDGDEAPPARSRRAAPEETVDETPPRRGARSAEPEQQTLDRPRRRAAAEDAEEAPWKEEDDPAPARPRRAARGETPVEEEETAPPARTRRPVRGEQPVEEEQAPASSRRRAVREEAPPEGGSPTGQARAGLERLRNRRAAAE